MTVMSAWDSLSSAQSTNADRFAERLQSLSHGAGVPVEYSVVHGATNDVVKEAHPVDRYVQQGRPAHNVHQVGMLRGVHAMMNNATGEVFHPSDPGRRMSADEALSLAAKDPEHAHLGAYLRA